MSETSRKIRELIEECEKTADFLCEKTSCDNCPLVKRSLKKFGVNVLEIDAKNK